MYNNVTSTYNIHKKHFLWKEEGDYDTTTRKDEWA